MMQLACMGAARQCSPMGPQEKCQLVARPLSTLVLLLKGGDGSFTALKKNYRLGMKTSQSGPTIMFLF